MARLFKSFAWDHFSANEQVLVDPTQRRNEDITPGQQSPVGESLTPVVASPGAPKKSHRRCENCAKLRNLAQRPGGWWMMDTPRARARGWIF
jgi:hypothetical protein